MYLIARGSECIRGGNFFHDTENNENQLQHFESFGAKQDLSITICIVQPSLEMAFFFFTRNTKFLKKDEFSNYGKNLKTFQ